MRTIKKAVAAGVVGFAALAPAAGHAQLENVSVTVGVKSWVTAWNTWFAQDIITQDLNSASDSFVYNRKAPSEVTWIPQLTVRSGPWLVSASALARRDFTFYLSDNGANQLTQVSFERKEYDVNAGYSLAPGAIITLGYKNLRYASSNYRYEAKGPTLGFSGSAPLAGGFSMYGNIAVGRPKIDGGTEDKRGSYLLTEVGVAYPLGQMNDALKTAVVTAGYRYQRLSSGDQTVRTFNGNLQPIGERSVELVDVTEGFTLGASFTF